MVASRDHIVGEPCYLIDKETRKVIDIFPSKALGNAWIREAYEKIFYYGAGDGGKYVSVLKHEVADHVSKYVP